MSSRGSGEWTHAHTHTQCHGGREILKVHLGLGEGETSPFFDDCSHVIDINPSGGFKHKKRPIYIGVKYTHTHTHILFFISRLEFGFLICKMFTHLNLAALLKRQGLNVKGLLKADPENEEPEPYIDCTGNLQVLFLLFIYFGLFMFCMCC